MSDEEFVKTNFIVGVSNEGADHPHLIKMRDTIVRLMAQKYPNVKVVTTDGGNDVAKQVAGIEDMVAQGADLIVIQAGKADAIISEVHELEAQGIPYMFSTNPIHGENSETVVAADNALIGKQVGEFTVNYLQKKYGSPKGNVLIIEGITGSETNELRVGEFLKIVKQYPDIKIGASLPADYRRPQGHQVMSDMLTSFGPGTIDVVFAANGEMAIGAAMAIEDAGREKEGIAILSIDGGSEEFDYIRQRKILAAWTYSACGPEAVDAIVRVLKGEKMPDFIVVPSDEVTIANVERVEPAF
jgi:ribose transport system substrate-binding protein